MGLIQTERERIGAWIPWVEATRTIDDQREWLEGVIQDERNLDGLGIFVEGSYVGGVGMLMDAFRIAGDIDCWIGGEHEGRASCPGQCGP